MSNLIFLNGIIIIILKKKNGWELKATEIADLMLKLQNETKCHNINFGNSV